MLPTTPFEEIILVAVFSSLFFVARLPWVSRFKAQSRSIGEAGEAAVNLTSVLRGKSTSVLKRKAKLF